jgi:hypothetical protein
MKDLDEFGRHNRSADGLHPWCRECVREYDRVRGRKESRDNRGIPYTRICASCGAEKPLTKSHFLRLRQQVMGVPDTEDAFAETCVECMFKERLRSTVAATDNDVANSGNTSEGDTVARATDKTKVCTRCKKRRKKELFYKDKANKDGLSIWCKPCEKDYAREYAARKRAEKAAAAA